MPTNGPIDGQIVDIDRESGLFAVWVDPPNLVVDFDIALLPDGYGVNDRVEFDADGTPRAVGPDARVEQELADARQGARQLLDWLGLP